MNLKKQLNKLLELATDFHKKAEAEIETVNEAQKTVDATDEEAALKYMREAEYHLGRASAFREITEAINAEVERQPEVKSAFRRTRPKWN
jgi:hypothetical protein